MTKEEFVGYCKGGIEIELEIINEDIQINGEINYTAGISNVKIYRDITANVDTSSTLIATITPTGDSFSIFDNNVPENTYYYRAIAYYDDGSYALSSAERAAKKLYVDKNANGIQKGTSDEPYKYIGIGTEYGNTGSIIYVGAGTYKLDEDPEIWDAICLKSGMKIIGSCNSSTWTPNINLYPTIIDASGCWSGFVANWENDISIENFIIKNANGNGIEINSSNVTIKNCVIYGNGLSSDWGWGIDLWGDAENINIINCTIDNNNRGIGCCGNNISVKNCIITNNHNEGVEFWNCSGLVFSHNDVWGNTWNYSGIDDQTGINGNISADPLFVDLDNGNYRLSDGSPCIGAGEDGVDMGAYSYVPIEKGDINGNGEVDISDVILCLRMAIFLDIPNLSLADMNNDGSVNITDVILILRKAIGLD